MSSISSLVQAFAKVYTLPKDHASVVNDTQDRFPGQRFEDIFDKKGSQGDVLDLLTNSFKLTTSKSFFQYSFKADEASKGFVSQAQIIQACKRALEQLDSQTKRSTVFDGAGVFICSKQLPESFKPKLRFTGEDGTTRECDIIVVQKQLKLKDMAEHLARTNSGSDTTALAYAGALNRLVHDKAVRDGIRSRSGAYAFPPGSDKEKIICNQDVEAWKAFFSAVKPTGNGLTVNVNPTARAIYVPSSPKLSDLMLRLKQSHGGVEPDWKNFLGQLEVSVNVRGGIESLKRQKIKAFGPETARNTVVNVGGSTVAEVYRNQGLLHAGDLPVVVLDTVSGDVTVPAELCTVEPCPVGQALPGSLTEKGANVMREESCVAPEEAEEILKQAHTALGLDSDTLQTSFGLQISNDLLEVKGRVLKPGQGDKAAAVTPNEAFRKAAVLAIRDSNPNDFGSASDNDFVEAVRLLQAVLVHKGAAPADLNNGLLRHAVLDLSLIPEDTPSRYEAARLIRQDGIDYLSRSEKPSILFVFASRHDEHIRPIIKSTCDIELGIPTIFIDSQTLRKGLSLKSERVRTAAASGTTSTAQTEAHVPLLFNVALRANAKLGAPNFKFSAPSSKLFAGSMLVGIGISRKAGQLAVAAVVASRDSAFVDYPASIRWQEGQQKTIVELDAMVSERIKTYIKVNKRAPSRVIVFRNGSLDDATTTQKTISGSQTKVKNTLSAIEKKYGGYKKLENLASGSHIEKVRAPLKPGEIMETVEVKTVLGREVEALRKAFKANNCSPLLTIITCVRGHKTRFYPKEDPSATLTNPPAGTVVDDKVIEPNSFSFYLQSHSLSENQDICVTVRPTKYTVMHDESKLTADELQNGIYELCHLSNIDSGSVSLVPPALWASKASNHARAYLHDYEFAMDGTMTEVAKQDLELNNSKGFVNEALKDSMFYV